MKNKGAPLSYKVEQRLLGLAGREMGIVPIALRMLLSRGYVEGALAYIDGAFDMATAASKDTEARLLWKLRGAIKQEALSQN